MKVLLASRNPGKLREFAELLPELELVPWPEGAPEIPETGAFFSVSPAAIRETSHVMAVQSRAGSAHRGSGAL